MWASIASALKVLKSIDRRRSIRFDLGTPPGPVRPAAAITGGVRWNSDAAGGEVACCVRARSFRPAERPRGCPARRLRREHTRLPCEPSTAQLIETRGGPDGGLWGWIDAFDRRRMGGFVWLGRARVDRLPSWVLVELSHAYVYVRTYTSTHTPGAGTATPRGAAAKARWTLCTPSRNPEHQHQSVESSVCPRCVLPPSFPPLASASGLIDPPPLTHTPRQ